MCIRDRPRTSRRQPRDRWLEDRDGSYPGGPALAAVLPVTNGLVLWLRSDRGVETDAKGRVRQWNDLSGHGYHATQLAVPYARPWLDNAVGFRGLSAVLFDGEYGALRCETPLSLPAQREFTFAILCRTEFTAERQWPQRVFSLEPAAGEDYARPEAFAVTLTDDTDPAKGGGLTLVQDYGAPDRLGLDDWAAGTNPVVQRALVWVKKEDAPGKGSVRVMADGQPAGTDAYCIGFPPESWYRIADEEGLLIQDEFPIWSVFAKPGELDGDELDTEFAEWMQERWNHPCVVIWDACNETYSGETGKAIRKVRGLDYSHRPWDNGWGEPVDAGDADEAHPYHFIFGPRRFRMDQLALDPGTKAGLLIAQPFAAEKLKRNNPLIINEYGGLWLNRDGTPTALTRDVYRYLLGP